ncbi:MAG: ArsR family transcriptional regulator [Chloroflexi bacterium]|nr:MAG: ArsR family transcriptional regulator [Chloroflexota bacterium]MBL1194780.1 ArsR family transcriptional regulator [Chloroflexota bacterium]NOH12072.1 helix-turn-helix domain-containing protein [Chloroflexota bacterium]
MQSTRQKILTHLDSHHSASAVEISRALGMTRANVRHHLNVLQETGLVELAGQLPNEGRGRPTLLYMATHQAQTNNLGRLASVLIKEFVVKQKRNVGKRLQRMAKILGDGIDKSGSITQRLYASTRHLNSMQYNSHWEAHADGPRVIFGQCPYAAIIEEHPELCSMDALFLKDMLGMEVEQLGKIEYKPDGMPHCIFAVQNTP